MQPAIRVDNLSKVYRVNVNPAGGGDLREALTNLVKAPLHRLRHGAAHSLKTEEFWALRDVGFEVRPGEVLGVVGRNGAGKSTLLKLLSQITEPTSGRAEIRGRVGSLLEVGTGFHPELSGRENIFLNGAILGMRRREIETKFDEIVEFSGVQKFLDTPVKRYSSGMRVRLGFAVAAHLEPEILIVDEVLAVGDIGFQRKCLGKMNAVAKGGRTVLFVSHSIGAVRSLCDRVLWLEDGRTRSLGESDEVLDAYCAAYGANGGQQRRETVAGDKGRGEDYRLRFGEDGGMLSFLCGDPLSVAFTVESPHEMDSLSAGLSFVTSGGERFVSMSSKVQNHTPAPGNSKTWHVKVDLGEIPLNAGHYGITVFVGDGMKDVARFTNAFQVEVIEHDVFGWGKAIPPPRVWGSMYWAPEWSIAAGSPCPEVAG